MGDVGLVQAMSGASRRGCSGSDPRAPHLTSVLRPQLLRPRPLGSAFRVPILSPVAQKEEASPPASPHHNPGAILGLEKSGRQHRAGGCCGSGRAIPHSTQGTAVDGERGTPTPPRAPRSRPGGWGKRICLT